MKHHNLKMCGEVEERFHTFLASALDRGEWSALHSSRFIPKRTSQCTHWTGSRDGLDAALWQREKVAVSVEWNTCRPSRNQSLYWLKYPASSNVLGVPWFRRLVACLSAWRLRFAPWPVRVRFMVEKSGTGTDSSPSSLVFYCQCH
jgi:hypothetical protein